MKLRVVFLAFVLALVAIACTRPDTETTSNAELAAVQKIANGARLSEICTSGLEGFRSEFLPKVEKEVCAGCHNGDNANAPPWLIGDDEQMYLSVKNYVNFSDVPSSRLTVRAGNRHCGGRCNAEMAERMKGYLQKWWDAGESACEQSTVLRTEVQHVPQDLPKDRFVTMSWDLSSVDVSLRGVKLAVEMRKFSDAEGPTPGSYFLRKPRFVANHPVAIAVERVRILNNRNFQEATNQFERIHAVVSPDVTTGSALTYPVLSPEPLILVEDKPGADELMVTFDKLAKTTPRACRSMDRFQKQVLPIVEARACLNCHTPGKSADAAATTVFDMSGNEAELCAKFLGRTWPDPYVLPALVQYPLHGRFEHPKIFVGSDNVLPDWSEWIDAEWQ